MQNVVLCSSDLVQVSSNRPRNVPSSPRPPLVHSTTSRQQKVHLGCQVPVVAISQFNRASTSPLYSGQRLLHNCSSRSTSHPPVPYLSLQLDLHVSHESHVLLSLHLLLPVQIRPHLPRLRMLSQVIVTTTIKVLCLLRVLLCNLICLLLIHHL